MAVETIFAICFDNGGRINRMPVQSSEDYVVLSERDVVAIDKRLKDKSFFPFTLHSYIQLIVSYAASINSMSRINKLAKNAREIISDKS